jgi:hypothetical protein
MSPEGTPMATRGAELVGWDIAPSFKFQKIRHSGKIAFSRFLAGKCDFIRNPIWSSFGKKPNEIPHKLSFVLLRRPKRKFCGMTPFLKAIIVISS